MPEQHNPISASLALEQELAKMLDDPSILLLLHREEKELSKEESLNNNNPLAHHHRDDEDPYRAVAHLQGQHQDLCLLDSQDLALFRCLLNDVSTTTTTTRNSRVSKKRQQQ